jgi:hypothetical protein
MGMPWQLRRGERRKYKRPLFEELLSLDARWLARKKLIPKDWSTRRYDFSFVIPPIAALTLTNRSANILTRDGREQTVAIHWQYNGGIGHGSIRPMFVCQCGYGASMPGQQAENNRQHQSDCALVTVEGIEDVIEARANLAVNPRKWSRDAASRKRSGPQSPRNGTTRAQQRIVANLLSARSGIDVFPHVA